MRDLVIVTASVSAGVHAALVREHLREGTAAGGGFIAASVLLVLLIVGMTYWGEHRALLLATALVFMGLLVSYAFAVTTGLPVLQPEPEGMDALALATKGAEALGLAARSS